MEVQAAKPFFHEDDIKSIVNRIEAVLKSGKLFMGDNVNELEKLFAEYIGVRNAVAVNSGTSALEIPMRYFDVKKREVIVPTNSFVASANTVIYAGGRPVMADIREDTLCIDPESIKEKINSKTKGVMVVHLAGLVCPQIKEIQEICQENNLFLIEDAAHAHGASIDGIKAGNLGNVGCFSFFPTKLMTTGEGGIITTNNNDLVEYSKSVRHHGIKSRDTYDKLGYNWRMCEINAILGIHQLNRLEEFIIKRNEIAKKYRNELKNLNDIKLISNPKNIINSYYKFPIIVSVDAIKLQQNLKEKYRINTGFLYYPPIHLQPLYKEKFGYKEGDLPVSERILNKIVCLPMFVGMTDEQINYVIESLKNEINNMPM